MNRTDYWPTDDKDIERWKRETLNRVDVGAEMGCSYIVSEDIDGIEYCEEPEHNPFSNRCYYHEKIEG